ncbi:MAG: hypothetical protein GX428_00610 [Candidatus Atribacteria bacterium]|nr:hypothetical protein [Candidatus Atribacteria bacterium]
MIFSRQEKIVFIILASILVFCIGFVFYKSWVVSEPDTISNENQSESYIVQISGEVLKPGVYQVEEGTRLYQLIELSGGVTPQADLSGLNLAAPVHDGIRINIPSRNVNDNHLENDQLSLYKSIPLSGETESHGSSNLVVQINTASLEELKKLPGIGDVIAQRIIEYRQTHGPFHSVEELLNVKGIGEKKLQDIKDSIIF